MPKLFPPYVPPPRPVHPLEARIAELRDLDRQYLTEEIQLSADGARLEAPESSDKRELRALQLLADLLPILSKSKPKPKSPPVDPAARLAFLISERGAIERAITIAQMRLSDARLDQVREFMAASAADWNENVRQTAITICSLWALNRQRETLRAKSGNPVSRPTATIHQRQLLGLGAPNENQSAAAKLFVEQALDAGVITSLEVQQILGA